MEKTKEEKVYEIFQSISVRYDKSNNLISLGLQKSWKNYLIDEVLEKTEKNSQLLDLCCGTGDIGIALAQKREDLRIIGADFSPNMLEVAKKKSEGLTNIDFDVEDACQTSYKDETFDLVTISFGLRNTKDYEKVLREIKRILKNDGYILCLDSFVPDRALVRPFYRLYFKHLMPILGGGFKNKNSYKWLYQSTEDFLRKSELIDLYKKVGFSNIKCKSLMFGSCLLIEGKKI